jgi:hypothetical protein
MLEQLASYLAEYRFVASLLRIHYRRPVIAMLFSCLLQWYTSNYSSSILQAKINAQMKQGLLQNE